MKSIVYNKTFRCVVSLIATFAVIFTSFTYIPQWAKAYNEDVSFSFDITHDGVTKPASMVDTIYEGDGVSINVNWTLSDGNKLEDGEDSYSRVIQLDPRKNLNIPEFSDKPLLFANRQVGVASVEKDSSGNLVMVLKLTDHDFLTGENDRLVTGVIEGTMESGGTYKTGDGIDVGIAEAGGVVSFKYDDGTPVSSLDAYKSQGELVYDGGKWYQNFTVTATAKDGPVTGVSFIDTPGGIFEATGPEAITISAVSGCKNSSDVDIASGAIANLATLNGMKMEKGGSITIDYKMEVKADAFTGTDYSSSNTNKIEANYTNNKLVSTTTYPSTTWLMISKPSVTKTCLPGSTDEEQTWKISINVGAAAKAGLNLATFIGGSGSVVDTMPADIVLSSGFNPNDVLNYVETFPGSGIYEYTYKTTSTTLSNKESTAVENEVSVTPAGASPLKATATYVSTGDVTQGADVEKTLVGYDEDSKIITWKVVLTDVKPTYTNVYVKDVDGNNIRYGTPEAGKTWGNHKMNQTKVVMKYTDGATPTTVDLTSTLTDAKTSSDIQILSGYYMGEWGSGLMFNDTFIVANAGNPIELTFTSVVTDDNLKDMVYYNKATLGYTNSATPITKEDDATYEKTVFPSNALTKKGVPNNGKSTIDYTLTVDLYEMEGLLTAGSSNLILTDTLPDRLTFDSSVPVTLKDKYKDAWNGAYDINEGYYKDNGDGTYEYNRWHLASPTGEITDLIFTDASVSTSYNSSTNKLTFKIPVNSKNYSILKGFLSSELGAVDRFIDITFTAKIADSAKQDFATSDTPVSFTNEATGTYGGNPINTTPAIDVSSLTPPNLVTKIGAQVKPSESFTRNGAKFEIDINPGAVQLSTAGDKITGTDEMSGPMTYYLDTIEVIDVATGTPLTMGNGANQYTYKMTYDEGTGKNKLEFTLPDKKHLRVSYYGLLNVYADTNGGDPLVLATSTASISNSFKLTGEKVPTSKGTSTLSDWSLSATKYKFAAQSADGNVILDKYTTIDGVRLAVSGAEFELSSVTVSYTADPTSAPESPVRSYTVPADGKLTLTGLAYNTVYVLKETKGGTATDAAGNVYTMGVNPNKYYFVLPSSAVNTNLANPKIHVISSGNFVDFENTKETSTDKYITISKKEVGGTAEIEGAGLAVYKASDTTFSTSLESWTSSTAPESFKVVASDSTANNHELEAGDYVLVETGAPAGHKFASNIPFTINADGTITSTTPGAADGSTLTMRDAVMDNLYVSKQDLGGEEVSGAGLKIYEWNNSTNVIVGSAIESWTSSAVEAHKIDVSKFKISKGADIIYYMLEETATDVPSGYEQITDGSYTLSRTVFHIDEDGKMVIDKCIDDSANVISNTTPGYSKVGDYDSASKKVNGAASAKSNGLVIYNKKKTDTISISKKSYVDGVEGPELAGAKLKLFTKTKYTTVAAANNLDTDNVADAGEWTSGSAPMAITVGGSIILDSGKPSQIKKNEDYVLYEMSAPNGYEVINIFEFSVNDSGAIVRTGTDSHIDVSADKKTITVLDEPIVIYIDKQINGTSNQLANAILALYEGTTTDDAHRIATWASQSTNARKIQSTMLKAGGTYTLVESAAPTGYGSVAGEYNKYTFEIDKDGKITDIHQYATESDFTSNPVSTTNALAIGTYTSSGTTTGKVSTAGTTNDGLILYNKVADAKISISKKEIGGSAELAGASLQLYKDDYDAAAGTGTKVGHWTSTTTANSITVNRSGATPYASFSNGDPTSSITLVPGVYWLVETNAPNGYAYSEAIQFEIEADGKIKALAADSAGKLSADRRALTMEDGVFEFKIFKQDSKTRTGVEGATLTLTDETGSSRVVETFVSGKDPHIVLSSQMKANHSYKLVETTLPAGYVKEYDEITFDLDENGKIKPDTLQFKVGASTYDYNAAGHDNVVGLNSAKDTLLVSNKPVAGSIVLSKKAMGGSIELPGATFALTMEWEDSGDTKTAELMTFTSANVGKTVAVNNGTQVVKDSSGNIVSLPASSVGGTDKNIKYYIQEINNPQDYDIYANKVKFEINLASDGTTDMNILSGDDTSRASVDSTTLTIRDKRLVIPHLDTDQAPTPTPAPSSDDNDDSSDDAPTTKPAGALPKTGGVVGSVALMVLAFMMVVTGVIMLMPEKKTRRVRRNRKDRIDIQVNGKYENVD